MTEVILAASSETQMRGIGKQLAVCLSGGQIIYLRGCLGAGKTTLTGGIIHGLGHTGAIKSPTYTLVEPYELGGLQVNHFDLYRLADPEELEYIGIREYSNDNAICLFEWPERGSGVIPLPDLVVELDIEVNGARQVRLVAQSADGEACLKNVSFHQDKRE